MYFQFILTIQSLVKYPFTNHNNWCDIMHSLPRYEIELLLVFKYIVICTLLCRSTTLVFSNKPTPQFLFIYFQNVFTVRIKLWLRRAKKERQHYWLSMTQTHTNTRGYNLSLRTKNKNHEMKKKNKLNTARREKVGWHIYNPFVTRNVNVSLLCAYQTGCFICVPDASLWWLKYFTFCISNFYLFLFGFHSAC